MGFGFRALIQAGRLPEEAAAEVTAGLQTTDGMALLREYLTTSEGRELLSEWAVVWAEHGLRPPWDGLLDEGRGGADDP